MERKYCPLCFANSESEVNLFCEKENCEWWNGVMEECTIKAIGMFLHEIALSFNRISRGYIDDGK